MSLKSDIRIPPNNSEIESAVLGTLFLFRDTLDVAMPRLFPEIFYQEANRAVFTALRQIYDSHATPDELAVYEALKRSGEEPKIGGIFYLTKLSQNVRSPNHLDTHISILSELYLKRELSRVSQMATVKAYDNETDPFTILTEITTGVEKAHERVLTGRSKDITYYVKEMLVQHSEVKKSGVLGYSTGIESLDWSIGGLVKPDLIVLAARPGQGKTALALSITHNLTVNKKIPCAWFSFEMDGIQLSRRLTSINSGVDHERIRNGKTTEEDEKHLFDSASRISSSPLIIDDNPSMNIKDIRAKAMLYKRKHGIEYIVVDYLQLMEGDRTRNREQVVSDISRGLKMLAKELNVPVIALSQLNRSVEARQDKMPNLSDLRESGAIEQDADEVIFIMRPEYYGIEDSTPYGTPSTKNLAILKVDKNRHGETGTYYCHFNGAKMLFSNYKH